MHRITKVTHLFAHLAAWQKAGREQDERRCCINVSWGRSIEQWVGSTPQVDGGETQKVEEHHGPHSQPTQSRTD